MDRKKDIEIANHIWAIYWLILIIGVLGAFPYFLSSSLNGASLYQYFKPFIEWPYYAAFYIPLFWVLVAISIVDTFTRPHLYIIPYKTDGPDRYIDREVKYIHAAVINLNWPKYFILFRRKNATNVSAKLKFRKRYDPKVWKELDGRWATNKQPEKINDIYWEIGKNIEISPSKTLKDIKEGNLDIIACTRKSGKNRISGFNERNYVDNINNFPVSTEFELEGHNEWEVDVEITSGEQTFNETFLIINALDFDKIGIETLN